MTTLEIDLETKGLERARATRTVRLAFIGTIIDCLKELRDGGYALSNIPSNSRKVRVRDRVGRSAIFYMSGADGQSSVQYELNSNFK